MTTRKHVTTPHAPTPIGPYSQGVIAGGHDELQLGPGLTDFALLFDPTSLPPARMRWDSVGRGFRFSHDLIAPGLPPLTVR